MVLVARAAPPGLQCQLYAMVPLPEEEDDEPEEPWAASVPGASYEASVEDGEQDEPRSRFESGQTPPRNRFESSGRRAHNGGLWLPLLCFLANVSLRHPK